MKKHLLTILFLISTIEIANAQCPYNNLAYLSGPAPATVGATVSAPQSWGGDYNTVTGMVAGYTYEISTCGTPTFDSELTIFPAGGGTALAYDDDGCGGTSAPSKIIFTPTVSGDYDILLDEYPCANNQIDMTMDITLLSTGGGNPPSHYIPVVVHVVYKNSTENVSTAQIMSQITAMNKDFRKTNPDFSQTPGVFQGVGADLDFEFCLATVDPNGNPTSGITRTSTSVNSFSQVTHPKSTANGGHDNWNPTKYLNLWVCDLSGTLLGYATFPSDLSSAPQLDGVVIDYAYFGTIGTTTAPFDLGRTATHEVGHWLNLRHIWGDANCGDDFVADTPTQQQSNGGCPTFPHVTCSNGPNGDMFMNYMDYTNDACMFMFTAGQKLRTDATLSGPRVGLLTASGCGSVGINELTTTRDFNMFPNPANELITISWNDNNKPNTLNIYDVAGRLVYTENLIINRTNQTIISVRNLKGIYAVEIVSNQKNEIKKLVVQ